MKYAIQIGQTHYGNLLSHEIKIKSADTVYHFDKSPKVPRLITSQRKIDGDMRTYFQIDERISHLQKENILFTVKFSTYLF